MPRVNVLGEKIAEAREKRKIVNIGLAFVFLAMLFLNFYPGIPNATRFSGIIGFSIALLVGVALYWYYDREVKKVKKYMKELEKVGKRKGARKGRVS